MGESLQGSITKGQNDDIDELNDKMMAIRDVAQQYPICKPQYIKTI